MDKVITISNKIKNSSGINAQFKAQQGLANTAAREKLLADLYARLQGMNAHYDPSEDEKTSLFVKSVAKSTLHTNVRVGFLFSVNLCPLTSCLSPFQFVFGNMFPVLFRPFAGTVGSTPLNACMNFASKLKLFWSGTLPVVRYWPQTPT